MNDLRFVVEAKRWARPLDAKAIEQTLAYLADVGAQRALLTNGSRWLVLDAGKREPVVAHALAASSDLDLAVAALVAALAPFLSPSAAPTSALPAARVGSSAGADVDQIAEDDQLVGEFVAGIRALALEHAERIYVDAGPKGLLVRAHRTGRVIVPVNVADPLKPDLYVEELRALGVDDAVRGAYVAALRRLPSARTPASVTAFLAAPTAGAARGHRSPAPAARTPRTPTSRSLPHTFRRRGLMPACSLSSWPSGPPSATDWAPASTALAPERAQRRRP